MIDSNAFKDADLTPNFKIKLPTLTIVSIRSIAKFSLQTDVRLR